MIVEFKEFPGELVSPLRKKLEAETKEAEARTEGYLVQARQLELQTRQLELKEQENRATNRYHQIYTFNQPIDEKTVSFCIDQLDIWSRMFPNCDIEIIFNSPGGNMIEGFALFDYLQLLRNKGHKIIVTALGWAASMAAVLLQAGDVRQIGEQSLLLIHEASFGTQGKAGEMEDAMKMVKKMQKRIVEIFAGRSKMKATMLEKKWKRRDWSLTAEEALKYGLVDKIIKYEGSKQGGKKKVDGDS